MRLFISIKLPGPAKERLFALQKELRLLGRAALPRGGPPPHFGLFLGETPSGQADAIQNAMTRVTGSAGAVGTGGTFHISKNMPARFGDIGHYDAGDRRVKRLLRSVQGQHRTKTNRLRSGVLSVNASFKKRFPAL